MKNLLEEIREPFKLHNAFFTGPINNKIEKETFTEEDLWNYFVLSTKGQLEFNNKTGLMSRQEREELAKTILSDSTKPTSFDMTWIENNLVKHGVQVILYAIDEFAGSDWYEVDTYPDNIPPINKLSGYTHSAQITINNLKRDFITREVE